MGDRLRRLTARLLNIAFKAAMPGLIIYSGLLISLVARGVPKRINISPSVHLILVLTSYLTALFATLILEYREVQRAAVRVDEELIGETFRGFGKPDKLFCAGMDSYMRDEPRKALEQFLAVQDYDLTEQETGVLSFYIGRCYQILSCPSNAAPYYETAIRNGFPRHFAKLFQARCYSECGDFERSFTAFQDLLDHDPPPEFYFLYTDIGYLFLRQRKPEEAVEWFQRSIRERKNYAFALSGMAIASLQLGDFAAAKDYRYKALLNRLKEPSQFRSYYDETKALMLDEHPEWAEQEQQNTAAAPAEQTAEAAAPAVQDESAGDAQPDTQDT